MDALVLDPAGPLHGEPDRLLREETPAATALRPLLDVIGNGAHRISEIAGRLGRPASSLSRPLASLTEMGLVRRETPFGADPKSGKRSLYRIDDPFLRLWFRVVAPHRAALAAAPRETRLGYWRRYRQGLESFAWEELCRMAVPALRDSPLGRLGPWENAQRYWRGNAPELDIVARSVDGRRLLVGEAKRSAVPSADALPPGARDVDLCRALFVPASGRPDRTFTLSMRTRCWAYWRDSRIARSAAGVAVGSCLRPFRAGDLGAGVGSAIIFRGPQATAGFRQDFGGNMSGAQRKDRQVAPAAFPP